MDDEVKKPAASAESIRPDTIRHIGKRQWLVRMRMAIGCLLAAADCHAEGPIYVDIGQLFFIAILFLGGLVVLLTVTVRSKEKAQWSMATLLFVLTPVLLIVGFRAIVDLDTRRNEAIWRAGTKKNFQAFAHYCKDRQRVVSTQVRAKADQSLLIRLDPAFRPGNEFDAASIQAYLVQHPALCKKIHLAQLTGTFPGTSIPNRGFSPEVRAFATCSKAKWIVEESSPRFELVLGESYEAQPLPWGGPGLGGMSRSSVRLIDTQTGTTLAQDTLYLRQYATGETGCMDGHELLATLIADVFPED